MTDDERIQAVINEIRHATDDSGLQEIRLASAMQNDVRILYAVARHILSRDPECVRVPMKGTVS